MMKQWVRRASLSTQHQSVHVLYQLSARHGNLLDVHLVKHRHQRPEFLTAQDSSCSVVHYGVRVVHPHLTPTLLLHALGCKPWAENILIYKEGRKGTVMSILLTLQNPPNPHNRLSLQYFVMYFQNDCLINNFYGRSSITGQGK